MSLSLRLVLLGVFLSVPLAAAPPPWARVKVGMTAGQIVSLLGEPLLRSKARGFELWTYDQGAEVLIYGTVAGWTAPVSARLLVRSQDVWRNHPAGDYSATLHSILRQPAPQVPVIVPAKAPRDDRRRGTGRGYEDYLQG
jgi:hypothetical protein